MKIRAEDHDIILSDVFNGIGIETDQGRFGIAQRDMGIEVMLDGKLVWSSTELTKDRPERGQAEQSAACGSEK